jgi:hypothetical protein
MGFVSFQKAARSLLVPIDSAFITARLVFWLWAMQAHQPYLRRILFFIRSLVSRVPFVAPGRSKLEKNLHFPRKALN